MTEQKPRKISRTQLPPLRPSLLGLLVTVVLTSLGFTILSWQFPGMSPSSALWITVLSASPVVALIVGLVMFTSLYRRTRERHAALERENARFAEKVVPALVARLRDQGATAQAALAATEQPAHPANQQMLITLAEEIARSESGKAAALAACANAAGRMQALATSMLADLREMEHRHTNETVLADLLHLDHRTAQAGRLADSIAVLTGARSGRRWGKPIVMESILRGAMGRIGGYQRVRLHAPVNVAIAGHAAEGVMHALAEILDNAANFSPPTSEVHVYVEEVPAGIIVTVEDSGLVMGEVALRRAERSVSTDEPLDLASLSGTRLGLAVVGRLARKHGLQVSFRPSARGGTGVLVMIPHELISRPEPADEPDRGLSQAASWDGVVGGTAAGGMPGGAGPVATPEHAPAVPAASALDASALDGSALDGSATGGWGMPGGRGGMRRAADGGEADPRGGDGGAVDDRIEYSSNGLPKRRRGRTLANAHPGGVPAGPAARPARSSEEAASRLRAFRQAVRGTPDAAPERPEFPHAPHTPTPDTHD